MSALFAIVSKDTIRQEQIKRLSLESLRRGKNSSALLVSQDNIYFDLYKSAGKITELTDKVKDVGRFCVGYAGLNVSHHTEIMPLIKNDCILFHSGIVNNVCLDTNVYRETTNTNSDYILDKLLGNMDDSKPLERSIEETLQGLTGTINCIFISPKRGKIVLFSNHGSLYYSHHNNELLVASEKHSFKDDGRAIHQVNGVIVFDILDKTDVAKVEETILLNSSNKVLPLSSELGALQYKVHSLKRCSKCVLPETMPYIRFDEQGVCNYCHAYKIRNNPKEKKDIFQLVEPYRKAQGYDCVIPFSGGRDSCYTLYIAVKELGLNPVTYTYDWGMVTDVGRRNISLMCGKLGIENIVISDDIVKKRRNIAKNFKAWLKNPDLGMLNILTAGDKHFFRYIDDVKQQTDTKLNLWGVNPLEVTHFKTGFLGIAPDFEKQRVYASGLLGQCRYHSKRLRGMLKSPGYFNSSLWDTYSGEYFRSFAKKTDYFHIFDYWRWSENHINSFLDDFGWERASDTPTTWRIGDGTAGIYNYIYYTLAGFSEHDTFRSNQVREGEITRDEALALLESENAPAHDNLRWYLKSIGFDFETTIKKINSIKREHELLY